MLVQGKEVLTPKEVTDETLNSSSIENVKRIHRKFGHKKEKKASINQDINRVVKAESPDHSHNSQPQKSPIKRTNISSAFNLDQSKIVHQTEPIVTTIDAKGLTSSPGRNGY